MASILASAQSRSQTSRVTVRSTITRSSGTVTNTGDQKQPSNALQFVDIFTNGQRVNDRGIPPLAPGQSYTFSYVWPRSTDAGNDTTVMRFSLRMVPPSQGNADCNPTNDTTTIRF